MPSGPVKTANLKVERAGSILRAALNFCRTSDVPVQRSRHSEKSVDLVSRIFALKVVKTVKYLENAFRLHFLLQVFDFDEIPLKLQGIKEHRLPFVRKSVRVQLPNLWKSLQSILSWPRRSGTLRPSISFCTIQALVQYGLLKMSVKSASMTHSSSARATRGLRGLLYGCPTHSASVDVAHHGHLVIPFLDISLINA
jgi:hypothetical protein